MSTGSKTCLYTEAFLVIVYKNWEARKKKKKGMKKTFSVWRNPIVRLEQLLAQLIISKS